MRKVIPLAAISTLLGAVTLLAVQSVPTKSRSVVVRGLLRDIACPVQNHESTSRKFNKQCAIDCAKSGAPLGILTDDGTIYLIISEDMPDKPQNEKLMPFVAKYVTASGTIYQRKGLQAITIKEIKEDKSVRLTEVGE